MHRFYESFAKYYPSLSSTQVPSVAWHFPVAHQHLESFTSRLKVEKLIQRFEFCCMQYADSLHSIISVNGSLLHLKLNIFPIVIATQWPLESMHNPSMQSTLEVVWSENEYEKKENVNHP